MRAFLILAVAALAACFAGDARAGHNEPPAGGSLDFRRFNSPLITAYEPCISPNDSSVAVPLPACHPLVRSDTVCGFDPTAGSGRLVVLESAAGLNVKVQMRGLLGCDGEILCPVVTIRRSTDDCSSGDPAGCTSADVSADLAFYLYPSACGTVSAGVLDIGFPYFLIPAASYQPPGKNTGDEIIGCGVKRETGPSLPLNLTFSCGIIQP
jgi:hypothetical protein